MATRKFLVNIDLDQNSLINTVIENRDSVIDGYPSTPVAGQIFYDENVSNKKPFYYDGTTWVAMSSATASSVPFSGVTTGTNITAAMTVGTGASMTVSGSGTINANRYNSNAIIALADGGTNANLTTVNGGVVYSTASALAITAAGSSGNLLQSNGASAPSWIALGSIDHGSFGGLLDDDHTQYVYLSPATGSRNVIAMQGSSGTLGLGITGLVSPSAPSTFIDIKHGTAGARNVFSITESTTDTSATAIGNTTSGNSNQLTVHATSSFVGPVSIAPTASATTVSLTIKQTSTAFSSAHNVFTVQTDGSNDIVNVYRSATSTYVLRLNTNAGSGGTVGYIQMDSYSSRTTGFVNTSAGSGANGGSINTSGALGTGGNVYTYGSDSGNGGSITTNAADASGGSINTANGGGSIDTTGNGSIQFGIAANRITVQGTASSGGRVYTLPNVGVNTFFVMSGGTQSITGDKTFSDSALRIAGAGSGVAIFSYALSSFSSSFTYPFSGASSTVIVAGFSGTSTTTTHAAFATSTAGVTSFRAIASGDLPSLTGTYLRVVPAATSDNTVAPTDSGVVGLVVKQTTTSPAKIFEVQTSGGSPIFTVGDSGGNTDVTVATNLTITGDLTINGTTTTVNTSILLVEDNFITVNSVAAVLDAGIEVERGTGGTGDNAFIRFKETVDQQWYIDNGTYEWIVARRYSGTITGDNSITAFNITHNMNSKNVVVQVYDSSDILVYPEVSTPNANYVTIKFKPAPGMGVEYRVVVIG